MDAYLIIYVSYRIEVNPVNGVFEAISEDLVDISDAFNLDRIDVTFTVGNDGPSSSPYAKLVIYWPLMDPEGPAGQFFLYPTRIDVSYEAMDTLL